MICGSISVIEGASSLKKDIAANVPSAAPGVMPSIYSDNFGFFEDGTFSSSSIFLEILGGDDIGSVFDCGGCG